MSSGSVDSFLRGHASAAAPDAATGSGSSYEIHRAGSGVTARRMHGGRGQINVQFFFAPQQPAAPALLLQYDIPPGASEGVHTHDRGHADGAWDEFYYIESGAGRMTIAGEAVPVKAGDNVHTPLGVSHGIENSSATELLRVYLVAISRGG